MADVNRKITLLKRPVGTPTPDCFGLEEEPIRPLGDGEVLIAVEHISLDAFIRTTLHENAFHGSVPIGGTVSALGVGRILESKSPGLKKGDGVFAPVGAQTHATMPVAMMPMVQKVDEDLAPLRAYLGALGLTAGLTAYFGMRNVGLVKDGDTAVVSGAAGAVGSLAGQIAKLSGASRVIGIAGGPKKVEFITKDLGFDAGIDYRSEDVGARLSALAPEGIDVFFDNVGGEILDLVLDRIAERGRVAICGAISQYGDDFSAGVEHGPKLYLRLAERYARMEGFTVNHFMAQFPEAGAQLAQWLKEGSLQMRETIEPGIESFPQALITLLTGGGGHMGKLLVEV